MPEIVYVQTPAFDSRALEQIEHYQDVLHDQHVKNDPRLMCLAYTSKTLYVYEGSRAHAMAYQQYRDSDLGIGPLSVRLWVQEQSGKHLLVRRSRAKGHKWSWPIVAPVDIDEEPLHALYSRAAFDVGIDPKDLSQVLYLGALHGVRGVGLLWQINLPRDYGFRPDKSLVEKIAWIEDPETIHPLSANLYAHWRSFKPYIT